MKKNMTFLLLFAAIWSGTAYANNAYISSAPVAYMVDMSSQAVLYSKDADRKIPPASMAKMMSTYVVFSALSKGKLKSEDILTVTPVTWQKWNNVGSTMFLSSGERVSVDNLLHGMVTLSGNDAAVVLAEGIAGSEAKFVQSMNVAAKRLGLKNSHFGTANGWPDEGKTITTARDLALLSVRLINDYPELYRQYFGQPEFRWSGVTQPNRNPLLGSIAGADGLKTGHTDEAGYCFAGTALQDGRRLVMVVAGLNSFEDRITESRKFIRWGFDAWRTAPLFKKGATVVVAPVQLGSQSSVDLVAPQNLAATILKAGSGDFGLLVRYRGPLKAPLVKGQILGELVVKMHDGTEQVMPLAAAQNVEIAGFAGRAWNGLKSLVGA